MKSTIPWSISGLVSLKEMDISENSFDAELPPPIGRLGNLNTTNYIECGPEVEYTEGTK
jgi:hypothetical protein